MNADPGILAFDSANLAIPHEAIQSIVVTRKWGSYRMLFEYSDERGRRAKLKVFLPHLPGRMLSEAHRKDIPPKVAIQEHNALIRDAFLRALPPHVAPRAEWRI